MADPLRQERVVGFTRMVQNTVVKGMRRVFTGAFQEKQLRNLRIVTEYPLSRQEYPAIIVDFNDSENRDAGIGHREIFYDPNGILRMWGHRRFSGSITFRCFGLTPLDRDIIYDAVVECFSFWRLPHMTLQGNMFSELYGSPDDPVDPFRALSQLAFNTDRMRSGGKSANPAPWGAEDALVYQKDLVVDCIGGFYNAVPDATVPELETVSDVFVYPHIKERIELPLYDSEDFPVPGGEIFDAYVVEATAEASSTESFS